MNDEVIIDWDSPEFTDQQETIESGAVAGLGELFTGEARQANLPPHFQGKQELASLSMSDPVNMGTDTADTMKLAATFLMSADPAVRKDALESVIPGVQFEEFEDTTLVKLPETHGGRHYVLNAPGWSTQDTLTATAQILGLLPLNAISALASPMLTKVGLMGGANVAAEYGMQQGARGLADSDEPTNWWDVTLSGLTGGFSESIGPTLKAIKNLRDIQTPQVRAEEVSSIKKGLEAADATGINLFPAQLTQNVDDINRQSYISQLTGAARIARKRLERQNEQVAKAVEGFVEKIAPRESLATGPTKIRNASEEAITRRKLIREEAASPFYKKALDIDNRQVRVQPVLDYFDKTMAEHAPDSQTFKLLKKYRDMIDNSVEDIPRPDGRVDTVHKMKQLHNTRMEIADEIDRLLKKGQIGKQQARKIIEGNKILQAQMEHTSRAYEDATKAFRDATPQVQELEDRLIGRLADIEDGELKKTARILFDPTETNPDILKQAKGVIDEVDPTAWPEIVRTHLETQLGQIRATLDDVSSDENLPGQFYTALFGNEKKRKLMYAAADKEMRKVMKFFETSLKRASQGRTAGSQTATRKEISEELKTGWFREFVKNPLNTIANIGEDNMFRRKLSALGEVLFDPNWRPELDRIMDLPRKEQDEAMGILLNQAQKNQNLQQLRKIGVQKEDEERSRQRGMQ